MKMTNYECGEEYNQKDSHGDRFCFGIPRRLSQRLDTRRQGYLS